MANCPVCGSVITISREQCSRCGTPLRRTLERPVEWGRKLSLLLPGISHLWRGSLPKGIFALFGSFCFLLWLVSGVGSVASSAQLALQVLLWAVLWCVWTLGWYWDSARIQRERPSPGRVASVVILLLFVANGLMIVILASLLTMTRY